MSKRISRSLSLLAVLALVTTGLLARHVARVSAQRASVATNAARNAAIVAATTEVLKETSELRELAILRPVKSGAQSRAEIERMLIKNIDEQMTPAEMHAAEVSLRKFGLAPNTFEYRPFIIKLLTEQVAGYYDPKVQQFHLADWLELEGQKPVMAHELTHALQDQHFNLRRFEKWPHGDSDAELAAHALIEGDATLAMTIYMAKNPLVALAFSRSLSTGVSTEQYNLAPRAMRESLIFPYLNGLEWATQVYKRGGWAAVSNAYTRLPLSTEQILHAEKYFNYERPVKVTVPDVTSLLNASKQTGNSKRQTEESKQQAANSKQPATAEAKAKLSTANQRQHPAGTAGVPPASFAGIHFAENSQRNSGSAGILPASFAQASRRRPAKKAELPTAHRPPPTSSWRRIDSDVNGEWTYYLILDQFLNSPAESKRAAAGWAGDRYALYEGPGGSVFLAQVTAWDTEIDAREFFDAYIKRTSLRYAKEESDASGAGGNTRSATPEPAKSNSEPEESHSWMTSEGRVVIERRGSLVIILEGIPAGADAEALARALSQ